ncbi:MAG: asparaginase [Gammaproteobacteria bacterium]
MKHILIVFTGGTIGSAASEGTITPEEDAPYRLISEFQRRSPLFRDVFFKTIQPLRILSENLAPAAWKQIISAIESEHPEQYDGIIVTHGTDTLAYTAATFGFYFHALTRPLLLVSSDYPLEHPKANGVDNFTCAIDFILNVREPGVFVPYRNQGQTMQVHRGTRLASSLQLSGDFFSVRGQSCLTHDGRRFSGPNLPPVKKQPDLPKLKAKFSDRLLLIRPYPGLDYTHFNLERLDAVLHDLYHSGTACATERWGEQHSLLEFISRCGEQGVKVYLAPSMKSPDAYESTRSLMSRGAEMIWNLSLEAAYAKLMLAYGNFKGSRAIMKFLDTDIAGEHV